MPDAKLVRVLATGDAGLIAFAKSPPRHGEDIDYFVRGDGLQDLFGLGRITGLQHAMGLCGILGACDDEDRAVALC